MGIYDMPPRAEGHLIEAASESPCRFLVVSRITVAKAGKRTTLTTITMNNASTFSSANRKQLADLLKKYGTMRDRAYDNYHSKYQDIQQSVLGDYVEEQKGVQLVSEIAAAQEELDSLKESLSGIGLELDGKVLSISWSAPKSLNERIEQQIERSIGKKSDIDERFDRAQVAILTASTLEDAQQIMKSVSDDK